MDPLTSFLLDQIPPELLERIFSLIDRKSAIALSAVSQELRPYGIAQLWHHLDLSYERTGSYFAQLSNTDSDGSVDQERQAQLVARRLKLRRRLEAVIAQGDHRWGLVKAFTAVLRPGAEAGIVKILGKTSSTIRSFEMERSSDESGGHRGRITSFDRELLACERELERAGRSLAFPMLTHILLGHTLWNVSIITLLVNLAPNLTSLDFSLVDGAQRSGEVVYLDNNHQLRIGKDTELVQLRIDYSSEGGQSRLDDLSHDNPFTAVVDLLVKSPLISMLSLSVHSEGDVSTRLTERIAALKYLEDASWEAISDVSDELVEMPGSEVLRRLALEYGMDQWRLSASASGDQTLFPALQVVFIHSTMLSRSSCPAFPRPAPVLPLKAGLARWLRQRPKLRDIYFQPDIPDFGSLSAIESFDRLERSPSNGRITSIRRGDEELLIVRLRLYDVQVERRRGGEQTRETRRIIYSGRGFGGWGAPRGGKPAWQVFTSYDGLMVPLEIVERINSAEDAAGEVDWDKRGVEVGEAAWQILRDWREIQPDVDDQESEDESDESDSDPEEDSTDDGTDSEEDSD